MGMTFADEARLVVFNYIKPRLEKTDIVAADFTLEDDVYTVWTCFILGNWKVLISTTLPDGMYYEVSRNGSRKEIYLDVYKKFDNVKIFQEDRG